MATQSASTLPSIARLAADGRAQLLEHVDGEIAGLKAELERLTETRRALTGRPLAGQSTTTHPGAQPGNGDRHTTRTRTRGATRTVTEEAVLEAIRAGMGDQSPKLAAALRATPETILRRLKTLEGKGLLRREGERAGTRWVIAGATSSAATSP